MQNRPIIPLLVAFIGGIFFGHSFELPMFILAGGLAAALGLLLLGARKKWRPLIFSSMLIALFVLGTLHISLYLYQKPGSGHIVHYAGKEKLTIDGLISEDPQLSPDRTNLTVSALRLVTADALIPVEGQMLISVPDPPPFKYGDVVRFKARLRIPHNFQNPGGFDYERYLRYQRILVRGVVNDPAGIFVLREGQGNAVKMRLEKFRSRIKEVIANHAPSPEREIIQASILGNQKEIPEEISEKFNQTGTSHIIAISGFNIGIIAFFSFLVTRWIFKSSEYLLLRYNMTKVTTVMAILPIIIFAFVAGLGISVLRATIMVVTFMVAILIGKERDLYNILALAALIILAIAPYSLFDVSFQLSFVAVAAILFITPRLIALIPKPPPEEKKTIATLVKKGLYSTGVFIMVSLAAMLGTMPLIAFYFNRISLIALPANLVVVPLLGILAIPVCTAIILTTPLSSFLTGLLVQAARLLVSLSLWLIDFFASLPGASLFVATPTSLEMSVCYVMLGAIVLLIDLRQKRPDQGLDQDRQRLEEKRKSQKPLWLSAVLAGGLLFFAIDAVILHVRDRQAGRLSMTVIDVGQGHSTLLRFPGGYKMLVDGGGLYGDRFDIGKYVIAPLLWHEKIGSIDTAVLTHPHPDHMKGLTFIVEHFGVREIWTTGEMSEEKSYQDLMKVVRKKGLRHRIMSAQTPAMDIGGVAVRFLHPQRPLDNGVPDMERPDDVNNLSLVMRFTYRDVSFLITGDISAPTEASLVSSGIDLKSDVMVAPHHGAFSSSTPPFLQQIRPEAAIVPCGRDNLFGHPHPDVLRRFKALNARVWRTDTQGAVNVTTDGKNMEAKAFKKTDI